MGQNHGCKARTEDFNKSRHVSGKVVAVSGSTSTVAIMSCCEHYLTNILPAVCAAGAVAFVAQYQIELFWSGLAANLAEIMSSWPSAIDTAFIMGGGCNDHCGEEGLIDGNRSF